MSRDWLAIYPSLLSRPKYRRLSIPARAALFHLWLLAGLQTPEATWSSRSEVADILDLDGFPTDVIDELVERRWLDVDADGRVLVHDWDEHQLSASTTARRAYERDRKADWRRARVSPAPSSQDQTTQGPDRTVQRPGSSPSVRDTSGTTLPNTSRAIAAAWLDATGRSLIGSGAYAMEIIDDSARRHPEGSVIAVIREARATFGIIPSSQALASEVRNRLDPIRRERRDEPSGGHTRSTAEVEEAFSG